MSKTIHIALAQAVGGREGSVRTPNGSLNVILSEPKAAGEQAIGTNPEQLFAAGYSACFGSAVQAVAWKRKLGAIYVTVDGRVGLARDGNGDYGLSVALVVTLPDIDDPELARSLVIDAHVMCPYSRAIQGNVQVELSVNGAAISSSIDAESVF